MGPKELAQALAAQGSPTLTIIIVTLVVLALCLIAFACHIIKKKQLADEKEDRRASAYNMNDEEEEDQSNGPPKESIEVALKESIEVDFAPEKLENTGSIMLPKGEPGLEMGGLANEGQKQHIQNHAGAVEVDSFENIDDMLPDEREQVEKATDLGIEKNMFSNQPMVNK